MSVLLKVVVVRNVNTEPKGNDGQLKKSFSCHGEDIHNFAEEEDVDIYY